MFITIYDTNTKQKLKVSRFNLRNLTYSQMLAEVSTKSDSTLLKAFSAGCLVGCASEHLTILFNKEFQRSEYDKQVLQIMLTGLTTVLGTTQTEQSVKDLVESLVDDYLTKDDIIVIEER